MALIELYSLHQHALLQAAVTCDRHAQERLEIEADRLAAEITDILANNGSRIVKLLPAAQI